MGSCRGRSKEELMAMDSLPQWRKLPIRLFLTKKSPHCISFQKANQFRCVCVYHFFSFWQKMIETVDSRQGEMNAKTRMD